MKKNLHNSVFVNNPNEKYHDLIRKIRISAARLIRPKPITLKKLKGWLPTRVPIAGVMHQNQFIAVSELSLLEKVILRREPENEFDPNAIEIKRLDGKRLGYVGKAISKNLAPFMDKNEQLIYGLVTDITSDISGSVIGASICFYLPENISSLICCEEKKDIDYFIETASGSAVYLFVSCDEAMLNQLNDLFLFHKFNWVRSGLNYRPASNGMQYRWYVRFEGISPESIRRFLQQELSIIPHQERMRQELFEYMRTFDSENENLKQQQLNSQEVIQTIRDENDLLRKSRSNKWNNEIRIIINELLPNIDLKRDSLDVITHELKDYQQILKFLHIISYSPDQLKGFSVESAKGWREKHFSTGEKDDGRIYYKHVGEKWSVLISDKKSQPHDIQWLKKN